MQATDATQRIAKSSAEAASGYATAAFVAYAEMASQTMNFWAKTIEASLPKKEPEPRSWYRRPADIPAPPARRSQPSYMAASYPAPSFMGPTYFGWPMLAAPAPAATMFGAAGLNPFNLAARSPFDMWNAWLRMWPLQGPPACWPMAFAMMGAGVSRDVAYPAARANVAMLDVVSTAAEAVRAPFSSYHSDNGYASAQMIIKGGKTVAAMMLPLGAGMLAPWFDALAGATTRF